VREGRCAEFASFGWDPNQVPDPQAPTTFAASQLDWTEPDRPGHRELLEWYRDLLRVRREHSELSDGRLDLVQVRFDESAAWLVFRRGRVVVACNFAPETRQVPLEAKPRALILASRPGIKVDRSLRLPPESVAIVEVAT
jgi:maltooligosyltrehalose trehalohydrolase